jgi:hypothetical protein
MALNSRALRSMSDRQDMIRLMFRRDRFELSVLELD